MPALMVQGCTSWAGKSWLVTALCRWFVRQGLVVAPFKAQNMSNNARALADGGEIGVAQWLQARAAGVEPVPQMNPVLVKPEHGTSHVIRMGHPDPDTSAIDWRDRAEILWPTARDALDELLAGHDLVVIEGAGSPAEINLAAADIVNMRVADHADAPVLITVDIDRGGAFAHLFGTWSLVDQRHRERISGFVLNRFRGDASLLPPGPEELERMTGVPTIGVIPMVDHDLPDEDGAALHRTPTGDSRPRVAVVRYPTASNLDEFTLLEQVADLSWAHAPHHLTHADMIVLPGSRDVPADLAWLHANGLGAAIVDAAQTGTRVLGICGGLQLLGATVGHEGETPRSGLGLLPVATRFATAKRTGKARIRFVEGIDGPWRALAGQPVDGYEIRHGVTQALGPVKESIPGGLGWVRDNVLGVYVHGLLEHPALLDTLFGQRPRRGLDDTFELLADVIEEHLDTHVLRRLAQLP